MLWSRKEQNIEQLLIKWAPSILGSESSRDCAKKKKLSDTVIKDCHNINTQWGQN